MHAYPVSLSILEIKKSSSWTVFLLFQLEKNLVQQMAQDIFLYKCFQQFQIQSVQYIRDTCLVFIIKKSAIYKTTHQNNELGTSLCSSQNTESYWFQQT